jgi:hypothetical protein
MQLDTYNSPYPKVVFVGYKGSFFVNRNLVLLITFGDENPALAMDRYSVV